MQNLNLEERDERLFHKLNLMPVQKLGEGSNGSAFLLNDGRVMKLTSSRQEYAQSTLLRGRDLKRLANIHDTYALYRRGQSVGYAILQERIDTSRECELKQFDDDTYFYARARDYVSDRDDARLDEVILDLLERYPHYEGLITEYRLVAEAQINAGFKHSDLFNRNLGFKNGILTIFDYGYSRVDTDEEPIKLEL